MACTATAGTKCEKTHSRCSDNEISRRDIPSFIEPRLPLISNPFMRPKPQKGINLLELFEEYSECEEPELVQVYLRLNPCNNRSNLYEVRSDRYLITSLDTATVGHGRRTQHNVSKMYTFSQIFGPETNQNEIFENVVKDNLKKLPEGKSFTLLTYGASGSGKTFTLMGTVASPGLVPRSLEYVFKMVDAAQTPLFKPSESGADKLSYVQQEYELQDEFLERVASGRLDPRPRDTRHQTTRTAAGLALHRTVGHLVYTHTHTYIHTHTQTHTRKHTNIFNAPQTHIQFPSHTYSILHTHTHAHSIHLTHTHTHRTKPREEVCTTGTGDGTHTTQFGGMMCMIL